MQFENPEYEAAKNVVGHGYKKYITCLLRFGNLLLVNCIITVSYTHLTLPTIYSV